MKLSLTRYGKTVLAFTVLIFALLINTSARASGLEPGCELSRIANCGTMSEEECTKVNQPNPIFQNLQQVFLVVDFWPVLTREPSEVTLPPILGKVWLTNKLKDRFGKIFLRCVQANSPAKNTITVLENKFDPLIEKPGNLTIYVTLQTLASARPVAVVSFIFYRPDGSTLGTITPQIPHIFSIPGTDEEVEKTFDKNLGNVTIF